MVEVNISKYVKENLLGNSHKEKFLTLLNTFGPSILTAALSKQKYYLWYEMFYYFLTYSG